METQHALLAGKVSAEALLATYGAPLYVYDTAIIARQYAVLRNSFAAAGHLEVHYACKALTNLHILQYVKQLGCGADTVSIQEVDLALLAGFEPHEIMFTPNCVSFAEVEAAIQKGVRLNLDNLPMLALLGEKYPEVPVCIRFNPSVLAGGNAKISVGHEGAKFGVNIRQLPAVLDLVSRYGLQVEGVHMHTGSDILDVAAYLEALEALLGAAAAFKDLQFIDIGSGFKVAYKAGGPATDMALLGQQVSDRFRQFCQSYGRPLTLVLEPGKFLVSEAGILLVPVNVVKRGTMKTFVGVDSGLNHLIRPMFYDAYHEITNLSRPQSSGETHEVVGYICETDTFGSDRTLGEVQAGDILAIHNAGAYCMSMASNYNSRFRPAEVLLQEGAHRLIRRRETLEDILSTQVPLRIEKQ